ncbi:DNA-binding domain-containing protein [Arenicella sp.]|nr:DNA-binding domain-containing protein [Arenicella sp.]
MPPRQFSNYTQAFSDFIETGDMQSLVPYLADSVNPAFLQIYRNGAAKACLDALAANFPSLQSYLGVDQFKQLGREYVFQFWPTDARLSTYGDQLANYIATTRDKYPAYSFDIARLDRAWLDALFASDEKPLRAEDISALFGQESQQDLFSLKLASSVNLLHLENDCMSDWLSIKFTNQTIGVESGMKSIMLWRHEQVVQYRALSTFEDCFISAILESGSILSAAETAVAGNPNEDLGVTFAGLLSAGILIKK